MRDLFSLDGGVFNFLSRVADLVILNVVFIFCCIPIFTIGASVTALHYVTMKMAENEESYIVKGFFKSFRENFKQSTVLWLLALIFGIILFFDFNIIAAMESSLHNVMIIITSIIGLFYLFTLTYLFPLQAKFYNKIICTIKNSFLISIKHLPLTILMCIIWVGPSLVSQYIPILLPYWMMGFFVIGFALTAFCNSFIFLKVFKNYIPQEEIECETEE